MSVEDNILSVLQMTKFSKKYQHEKLETLISEFSLQTVRKSLGDQLSGGEREVIKLSGLFPRADLGRWLE